MGFTIVTPSTTAVKVPLLASEKLRVTEPTVATRTCEGSQGCALYAGPVVRYSAPEYLPLPATVPSGLTSHSPLPLASYVNHVEKSVSPCCVKLMPHPDSEPVLERHHNPWTLTADADACTTEGVIVCVMGPAMPLPSLPSPA